MTEQNLMVGAADLAPAEQAEINTTPNGFALMGLAPELLAAVADLGFTQPTTVQLQCIGRAMAMDAQGKAVNDLMVSSQTGSGKTAAFLLPVLNTLLKQQADELGDEVSFKRTDLGLFDLDITRRIITCRLVEVKCYRYQPHSSDDDDSRYRSKDALAQWRAKDPVDKGAAYLTGRGVTAADLERIRSEIAAEIERAIDEAAADPDPRAEDLLLHVYAKEGIPTGTRA